MHNIRFAAAATVNARKDVLNLYILYILAELRYALALGEGSINYIIRLIE